MPRIANRDPRGAVAVPGVGLVEHGATADVPPEVAESLIAAGTWVAAADTSADTSSREG